MIINDGVLSARLDELFPRTHEGNQSIDTSMQIQPASVDLRLGRRLWHYKLGMPADLRIIDIHKHDPSSFMTPVEIGDEGYVLKPGAEHFCLGETVECIDTPDDLVARLDGRSSLGRVGLRVHSTAGFIDPGFKGVITLEMDVVGRYGVLLKPGMRICQVSFHQLTSPALRPYGHPSRRSKYQNQTGATPSRINQDGDLK